MGSTLVLLLIADACGGGKQAAPGRDERKEAGLSKTTQDGPVRATVTLSPAKPQLGDRLELTLTVEAEPGVEVEMPAFGEALGRFAIVEFVPRTESTPKGGTVASQRYELEAPMSGRQRIPSLRVVFQDLRPGQPQRDAGAGERELFTEELAVEIASPTEGKPAELRPLIGRLPERAPSALSRLWPIGAGLGATGLLVFGLVAWRRHAARRVRESAYDVAMKRLAALEARGVPSGEQADAWYVELSSIVRRYLEDRFGIRAPELTTEEFMREASRAAGLTHGHRKLLADFLSHCDRVKFAGYRPRGAESNDALASARSFLGETRLPPQAEAPAKARARAA